MKKILLICLLLTFPGFSFADQNAIHEFMLDNGLKLIVKEDHRAPVVVSQVWYKIGSSYESLGITGISHVLEHMMFEGTQNYPDNSFSKNIAKNGGEENASTSYDYTYYFQTLAADRLPISFQMEADRMHNLNLSQKSYSKEIEVVKEERRLRADNNPQMKTYERFAAAAYVSNPYHHLTLGWMNDLNNMTLTDVANWYAQWYAPNNATLVVVGDVNPGEIFKLAQKYFGAVPQKKLPEVKPFKGIDPVGPKAVVVKTPAKLPTLFMGFNVPSLKTAHEPWEAYALQLAYAVLDLGNGARISKEIIRGKTIASSVEIEYNLYARLTTLFAFEAIPHPGHTIADLKSALLNQIKQLQDKPVTMDELERAKNQLISQQIYENDSLSTQAEKIGELESVGLSWKLLDEYEKAIRAITPEQIQKIARQYLIEDRMTIAELVPLPLQGNNPNADLNIGATDVR